jgi:aspartate aminotransferase-like enzyme
MDYANIGAYITAPQKGWSGPAAVGVCMIAVHKSNFAALLRHRRLLDGASDSLVDVHTGMMSDEAAEKASHAPSRSFTVDLHKWKTVMGAYRDGGHMYHATMPTDAIKVFRDVVHETEKFGLKEAEKATWDLGMGVRKVLKDKGYTSVAASA